MYDCKTRLLFDLQSNMRKMNPFLKWPGGKRWLAPRIADIIKPHLKGRYFEPFLGSGAVFFTLLPSKATLGDINEDLINTYRQVMDHPYELINRIQKMQVTASSFYRIRDSKEKNEISRAARFLYLNRTAFAGIYRLNRQGRFNVPYGGGERTPEVLWKDRLIESTSPALKGMKFVSCDFEETLAQAGKGDVIYCDPSYTVTHDNNGFIRYNERNFSWADQERLAASALRAHKRGAFVVVSNAYHPSIKKLFSSYRQLVFTRKSLLSTIPAARREVKECLLVLGKSN